MVTSIVFRTFFTALTIAVDGMPNLLMNNSFQNSHNRDRPAVRIPSSGSIYEPLLLAHLAQLSW